MIRHLHARALLRVHRSLVRYRCAMLSRRKRIALCWKQRCIRRWGGRGCMQLCGRVYGCCLYVSSSICHGSCDRRIAGCGVWFSQHGRCVAGAACSDGAACLPSARAARILTRGAQPSARVCLSGACARLPGSGAVGTGRQGGARCLALGGCAPGACCFVAGATLRFSGPAQLDIDDRCRAQTGTVQQRCGRFPHLRCTSKQ